MAVSPISATARNYVRSRATQVMVAQCTIHRRSLPEHYDEDTLVYYPATDAQLLYEGRCRIWEMSSASVIPVGDSDIFQQTTNLSIPWDSDAKDIKRFDEVTITECPEDPLVVGRRYEIQTVAKAGELRATRRFEVTGVL